MHRFQQAAAGDLGRISHKLGLIFHMQRGDQMDTIQECGVKMISSALRFSSAPVKSFIKALKVARDTDL